MDVLPDKAPPLGKFKAGGKNFEVRYTWFWKLAAAQPEDPRRAWRLLVQRQALPHLKLFSYRDRMCVCSWSKVLTKEK